MVAHDYRPGESGDYLGSFNETDYLVVNCYLFWDGEEPEGDEGGDHRVPAITAPCRNFPKAPSDDEERDNAGVEEDGEANAMQGDVQVRCRVSRRGLVEDAFVYYSCSAEHEEDSTGKQPSLADNWAHQLVEADGEGDG